jgi:RNA polymerase sigma factor for flagellar operon FliA
MTGEEAVTACERFIRRHAELTARRHPQSPLDADDLAQEARAAVLRAAANYDPAIGKPCTYFTPRIRGAVLDAMRVASFAPRLDVQRGLPLAKMETFTTLNRRQFLCRRGADVTHTRNAADAYRIDPVHRDPEPTDGVEAEFLSVCKRLFGALAAAERRLMAWYYVDEVGMREIAVRLGVSESRVSQMHRAVLDRAGVTTTPPAPARYEDEPTAGVTRCLAALGLSADGYRKAKPTEKAGSVLVACPHCRRPREASVQTLWNWRKRKFIPPCKGRRTCEPATEQPS